MNNTLYIFLFFFYFIYLIDCDCVPTSTNGCLNGVSYDYKTEFVCKNTIYEWATNGCCFEGLVFNTSNSFCCYDGIHDYDQYYCGVWPPNSNLKESIENRYKLHQKIEEERRRKEEKINIMDEKKYKSIIDSIPKEKDLPFDTRKHSRDLPSSCTQATSSYGCLNNVPYNFTTQYCCNSYIVSYHSSGCCNGNPHNIETTTCCFDSANGQYYVIDHGHACQAYPY